MEGEAQMPAVRRWRVECLGGPWWDGEPCVRFVDLLETQSLFDLHDGIQAAIAFDGDYPFCFFRAEGPEGPREMIPAELDERPTKDDVQVVNEDSRLFPGDTAVIVADRDQVGAVREIFREL